MQLPSEDLDRPLRRHRKSRSRLLIVAGLIIVLVAGFFVVDWLRSDDSPKKAVSPSVSAAATPTVASSLASVAGQPAASAASAAAVATPTVQLPLTSFPDGNFEVGVDIAPGTYKTMVPPTSNNCYWERQRSLSGEMGDIITNDNTSPGQQVIVKILPTDKGFKSKGCGFWSQTAS